jgi:ribose transport system substrate-binding protein
MQAAAAVAQKYIARPTQISLTQPVGAPIPTGKTIDYIHCGVSACDVIGAAITAAAKELGWTTKIFYTQGTPEGAKAAWTQAVNSHPSAVIANGFPEALFLPELKQLDAEGIPVVEASVTDPPTNGIKYVIAGPSQSAEIGDAMAARAVTLSGGKGDLLYVNLPDYPILVKMSQDFAKDVKTWCSACTLANINLPLTAIGTTAVGTIVSYLRSHPDVHIVTIAQSQVTIGLPAALAAAGLSDVKIVDESPGSESFEYVSEGKQDSTVFYPYQEVSWALVDGLARIFAHKPIEQFVPPFWLVTQSAAGSLNVGSPVVTGFEQQFLKLWGK